MTLLRYRVFFFKGVFLVFFWCFGLVLLRLLDWRWSLSRIGFWIVRSGRFRSLGSYRDVREVSV